ncbi:MAG: hypothetical protein P4L40_17650, partial [Terracidiphilus sp.]|nr:hypothetical protein [Terracidiphilus sp.]
MRPSTTQTRWFPANLLLRLDATYEWLYSETRTIALKRWAVNLSIAGFAIHLALIALARWLPYPPPIIAAAGRNYLAAISTPFNFILFYEVLTLIATLAASTTRSIAGQFEIVSLIFIRDVFRDIATASDLITEHRLTMETLPLFVDMWSGFLMFLLAAVFRHAVMRRALSMDAAGSLGGVRRFIVQKRAVSVGLTVLLIGMAAYNLAVIVGTIFHCVVTGSAFVEPATSFYTDLFTVMIFTDVLVLILSLMASGQYAMVFRNAAFVVATILIRFSLTEGYP